jgi:hypothetical protein
MHERLISINDRFRLSFCVLHTSSSECPRRPICAPRARLPRRHRPSPFLYPRSPPALVRQPSRALLLLSFTSNTSASSTYCTAHVANTNDPPLLSLPGHSREHPASHPKKRCLIHQMTATEMAAFRQTVARHPLATAGPPLQSRSTGDRCAGTSEVPFFGGWKNTEGILRQIGRGGMCSSIFPYGCHPRKSSTGSKTRALFLRPLMPVRRAHILDHVFKQPAATGDHSGSSRLGSTKCFHLMSAKDPTYLLTFGARIMCH